MRSGSSLLIEAGDITPFFSKAIEAKTQTENAVLSAQETIKQLSLDKVT